MGSVPMLQPFLSPWMGNPKNSASEEKRTKNRGKYASFSVFSVRLFPWQREGVLNRTEQFDQLFAGEDFAQLRIILLNDGIHQPPLALDDGRDLFF